ncbi:MAG TPA: right-handed parallel beta-helix repeat-containing protein [Candidatus Binatia bacterium]|jgi:parallel beta-helix repeat protein|nr:right-handed parallel beta-helix repeat-containing protein [Candidatus Binatia bacterium]
MKAFPSTWRSYSPIQFFSFFVPLSLFSILASSPCQAATYYVAANGTDNAPGTELQPLRNIAKGVSMLRAGDTLLIKQGTYAESINSNVLPIVRGSSWSTPVTIAAYPGHTVVLKPGPTGEVINLAQSSIQYLVIDRLVIDATNAKFGVSITNGARYIRIQNSEVKNSRLSGILLSDRAGYNQLINLKVYSNGTNRYDHGIYIATSHNLVDGCEIYDNSAYGVHIYNSASGERADNNVIQRSIIRNNGVRDESSAGIILSSGEGNGAYNNIVRSNPHGISVNHRALNSKVYNNVIFGNGHNGIDVGSGSTGALLKNNIVYKNGADIYNVGYATGLANNLTRDPKFVDPAAGNFSLQATSPAIDAGITLIEVRDDFNGVPRPQGTAYDIGAYEFKFASPASVEPRAAGKREVEPKGY